MSALAKAHHANVQNLMLMCAAAISNAYNTNIIISRKGLYSNEAMTSKYLANILELTNSSIYEFKSSFRISSNYITELQRKRASIGLILEILLQTAASNIDKFHYLKNVLVKNPGGGCQRTYYYLDVLRNEANLGIREGLNHTYWDARRYIKIDRKQEEGCYSPFYGLSFGHPTFIFDSLYARKRSNQTKRITYYEPNVNYHAYGAISSIGDILTESSKKLINIRQMQNNENISPKKAELILSGNHLTNTYDLEKLYYSKGIYSYSRFNSIKRGTDYIDSRIYIESNPIIKTIYSDKHQIQKIFSTCEKVLVIHTRDEQYTYGSKIRDSDFQNYIPLIRELNNQGIGVVRIATESVSNNYENERYIDLGRDGKFNLIDQLHVMQRADWFIGTSSGISHWATYFGKKLLMLNASAFPSCQLTDSVIHAGKTLVANDKIDKKILKKRLLQILKSSISENDMRYFKVIQLAPSEIYRDVMEFIEMDNYEAQTIHGLFDELGGTINGPDYMITNRFSQNIRGLWHLLGE